MARVQFHEGDSSLHQMHPAVKSVLLLALSISLFLLPSAWFIPAVLFFIVLGFHHAGVKLDQLAGLRLILVTTLFLFALQVFFTRDGEVLLRLGSWGLTREGLIAGVSIAGRFLAIVLLSYLFVLSTHPGELAYALMQTGVPYRYGYSLITALRMVPMFQVEAQTIYKAQIARGMRIERGGLRGLLTRARQMLMPLLVSALGKADTLAVSMEGRCFGMYPQRTYLRSVSLSAVDAWALVGLTVWIAVIAGYRILMT